MKRRGFYPLYQTPNGNTMLGHGQIVIAVDFFRPELVVSQSHIKGDHQCGQTIIPDYGQIFVAKRQIQSRHCGQMGIFNIYLMIILIGYFYIEKLSPMCSTHVQ